MTGRTIVSSCARRAEATTVHPEGAGMPRSRLRQLITLGVQAARWAEADGRPWAGLDGRRPSRDCSKSQPFVAMRWHLRAHRDPRFLSPGRDDGPVHATHRSGAARDIVDGSRWVSIWYRRAFHQAGPRKRSTWSEQPRVSLTPTAGRYFVYGTVLPWTSDTERGGMSAELARQAPEWTSLPKMHDAQCCLAGDLTVNLGGPHF